MCWWCPGSPDAGRDAVICDGAVRSGKTLFLGIGFAAWAGRSFHGKAFALCGRTIRSLKRNLLNTLLPALRQAGFGCAVHQSENWMELSYAGRKNRFYFFGGKDEGSAALIQGMTLAGVLLDEVALMPRSFVEQALSLIHIYLQIVSQEVKRLSRLVRTMLDLSRIDSGELRLHMARFDLTNTIFVALLSFEKSIEQKKIQVLGLEDTESLYVDGDPDMIHQVVYNLVENAVKFVNPQGYIDVQVLNKGTKAVVKIRNSGQGISADEIPLIFDKFYKTRCV